MNSEELINALKTVPECRLRLIELAWKVVGEDGEVDPTKIAFYHKEITEAIKEAEAYREQTKEIVRCLMDLLKP